MAQTSSSRGYDNEMPPTLASCLMRGTTWDLFCPACRRHVYPSVVDLLARFGDDFTSDVLWRRAVWACGERLKMAGGALVKWLHGSGDLHRMVMPARAVTRYRPRQPGV